MSLWLNHRSGCGSVISMQCSLAWMTPARFLPRPVCKWHHVCNAWWQLCWKQNSIRQCQEGNLIKKCSTPLQKSCLTSAHLTALSTRHVRKFCGTGQWTAKNITLCYLSLVIAAILCQSSAVMTFEVMCINTAVHSISVSSVCTN